MGGGGDVPGHPAYAESQAVMDMKVEPQSVPAHEHPLIPTHALPFQAKPNQASHMPTPRASIAAQLPVVEHAPEETMSIPAAFASHSLL